MQVPKTGFKIDDVRRAGLERGLAPGKPELT